MTDGIEAPPLAALADEVAREIVALRGGTLRPVINGTGVLIQTNLGRSPLSARALDAARAVAAGYSNLEFDLEAGERGHRHAHVAARIARVCGADDATAVNNNAGGVLLVLAALCAGRKVLVSRGQLVEIGGGFRIPDVLRQSGAELVEVGTTNRTYARDFVAAMDDHVAAVLHVHASNFRLSGFVAQPPLAELAAAAHEQGCLLLDDLGSGALVPTEQFGLPHEPMPRESLAAGADVVMFSGDKLLGGPQAGCIAGRADLLEAVRRHPLARALRMDKLDLAALDATLAAYEEGTAARELPLLRMLAASPASLRRRARTVLRISDIPGRSVPSRAMVGGGSLPQEGLDSAAIALPAVAPALELAARLRGGRPAVVPRVERDLVLVDLRAVLPEQDRALAAALRAACLA